ncbi:MAG: hypothetical protein FJ317_04415, partial [SAR202 cluster bacterium]|nr:hypothetical protein [SAR202 cluster bacterium]
PQTVFDSFFDVFVRLDALDGRIGNLSLADLDRDGRLDVAVSSRSSQASVDALQRSVDSFFDVFTAVLGVPPDDGMPQTVFDSFFDVFTELSVVDGKLDALDGKLLTLSGDLSTRASQSSVDSFFDVFTAVLGSPPDDSMPQTVFDSFFDVFTELTLLETKADILDGKLLTLSGDLSTKASQSSVDAVQSSVDSFFDVFTAVLGTPPDDNMPQTVFDSFFDVFVRLDALDGRIGNLSLADLDRDGRLDVAVSSRSSQASVDALQRSVDSFFDIFTELSTRVDSRASQASVDALHQSVDSGNRFAVDSFFDVFTELSAMDAAVDSFFDIWTEVSSDQSDALASLDASVATRASQQSVDAIEAKLDALAAGGGSASQQSVDELLSRVTSRSDQIDSALAALETKADTEGVRLQELEERMETLQASIDELKALIESLPGMKGKDKGDEDAPPTISNFAPPQGAAGASVNINGTGFTGATSVKFNGVSAVFTVNSPTKITATVPTGATTGKISVTSPLGTAESAANFKVLPKINSFTPTSGPVGTLVTINGSGFAGVTGVKFNGVSAAFTVLSSTSMRATVPAGATTGKISVTTVDGTVNSLSNFTVTP